MKKALVCFILTLAFSSCKQEKAVEEQTSISEQITETEALDLLHKWTNAYLNGDATPLNEVLDESWLYSGSSDGTVSDKAATIEEFSNADYTFADITYDNLDVRLFEDVAVVRGTERMVIVGGSGQDTTVLRLRFTDVYQKKDGAVKAIATHSSPINQE